MSDLMTLEHVGGKYWAWISEYQLVHDSSNVYVVMLRIIGDPPFLRYSRHLSQPLCTVVPRSDLCRSHEVKPSMEPSGSCQQSARTR